MNFIWGLVGIAFGTILIIKTEWFVENFGTSAWAEEHMGTSGGTRLMYKLVGIIIIFISMMGATGLLGGFVIGVFGKLFMVGG
jgi:hypothetical protein